MSIFNGNCIKKKFLSNNYDKQIGNDRISLTRTPLFVYLINISILIIIRTWNKADIFLEYELKYWSIGCAIMIF